MIEFDTLHAQARSRVKPAAPAARPVAPISPACATLTKGDSRREQRLDNALGAVLVAVVLISAIPAGSNRPVVWMIWAALLGAVALGYALATGRGTQLSVNWPLLALGTVLPVSAILQLLPVAGGEIAGLPGVLQPGRATISGGATALGVLRLVSYALYFVLVSQAATSRRRARAMAWGLAAGVLAHAVWGLVALSILGDVALWGEKRAYLGAATGTFVNRNSFATFLGMGLMVGLALVLEPGSQDTGAKSKTGSTRRRVFGPRGIETLALWLGLGMIAAAVVATQSRMGIVASGLGALTVFIAMRWKETGPLAAVSLRGRLVVVAALIGLIVLFGQGAAERGLLIGSAAEVRLDLHSQVLAMISARPWTGHGLDTFRVAYEPFHRPPVSSGLTWDHAHSTYLTLWAEMGVIAGSAPLLAVLLAARGLFRRIRRRTSGYAVPAAALGVVVLCAVHSLVDFSLEIQANTLMFIGILALGLGRFQSGGLSAQAASARHGSADDPAG